LLFHQLVIDDFVESKVKKRGRFAIKIGGAAEFLTGLLLL